MKPYVIAAVACFVASQAVAAPTAPAPPVAHKVTITNVDAQALGFALAKVGEGCSVANLAPCYAAIQLADWNKRAAAEVKAQDLVETGSSVALKTIPKPAP